MRYEDEPRVVIYTNKTEQWKRIGWDGRLLFWSLTVEADPIGCVAANPLAIADLAARLDIPEYIVGVGIGKLLKEDMVRWNEDGASLHVVDYLDAQNAPISPQLQAHQKRIWDSFKYESQLEDEEAPIGCIYALEQGDREAIKFGFSRSLHTRLNTIRTASSSPVKLLAHYPATHAEERRLHKQLQKFRLKGEWYDPAPEIMAIVERMLRGESPLSGYEASL